MVHCMSGVSEGRGHNMPCARGGKHIGILSSYALFGGGGCSKTIAWWLMWKRAEWTKTNTETTMEVFWGVGDENVMTQF